MIPKHTKNKHIFKHIFVFTIALYLHQYLHFQFFFIWFTCFSFNPSLSVILTQKRIHSLSSSLTCATTHAVYTLSCDHRRRLSLISSSLVSSLAGRQKRWREDSVIVTDVFFLWLVLTDIITYRSSKKMKERRCCKEKGCHRRGVNDLDISKFHGKDDGCWGRRMQLWGRWWWGGRTTVWAEWWCREEYTVKIGRRRGCGGVTKLHHIYGWNVKTGHGVVFLSKNLSSYRYS